MWRTNSDLITWEDDESTLTNHGTVKSWWQHHWKICWIHDQHNHMVKWQTGRGLITKEEIHACVDDDLSLSLSLCQMICETPLSAQQPADNRWKHTFSLPISTFSALGVSHVMRYTNLRYLFTYLLTRDTKRRQKVSELACITSSLEDDYLSWPDQSKSPTTIHSRVKLLQVNLSLTWRQC